ncbi:MAG: hypothetical protein GKR89_33935 [Candidatus Latescibacteria bacterium]|nr:hypothetical protein [Candidatus Latescibacterota bacterium]
MSQLPAIEIYSIGTELLMGQIQDTNSFWMSQQIAQLGGHIRRIAILDDDMDDMIRVFGDAVERDTRIVITTGGLGPTPDDLTVETVAQLMGVDVVVNESLIEHFMESRNIAQRQDVSPGLAKMATSPQGSQVHTNPAGVAPCVESQIGQTTVYNLPGPPREVRALFEKCLIGPIARLYSGTRATLRVVVNLPESECGPILHKVMQEYPNTYLKAFVALTQRTADGQRLPVDIVARGDDQQSAQHLLDQALAAFRTLAGEKGREVAIADEES